MKMYLLNLGVVFSAMVAEPSSIFEVSVAARSGKRKLA
jgi:hypothetical protein